jgi:hypothetical protein
MHPYIAAGRAVLTGQHYDNRSTSGSVGCRPGEYDGVFIRDGRIYHAGPAGQDGGLPYGSRHDDVTDRCLAMARLDMERERLRGLYPALYESLDAVGYNTAYAVPTETGCTLHVSDERVQAIRDALPDGYEMRCVSDPSNYDRHEIVRFTE